MTPGKIQVVVGDPIDVTGYTIDTVQDLIDKTRQTIIANFDPDYNETRRKRSPISRNEV
jgi:hypothetical protein